MGQSSRRASFSEVSSAFGSDAHLDGRCFDDGGGSDNDEGGGGDNDEGGGGDNYEGGGGDAHQQRADPESRSALWKSPTDFCGFNFQTPKYFELPDFDIYIWFNKN